MSNTKLTIKNQKGVISIVVTLILIVMIGIIVVAFSSFTRREQTQTFERQLSTEAYYAAESGINDAIERFKNTPSGTGLLDPDNQKDDCNDVPTPKAAMGGEFDYTIDDDGNVEYTCLLINPAPETLVYSNIDVGDSEAFPIVYPTPAAITSFEIWWHDPNIISASDFSGCGGAGNIELPRVWYNPCDAGTLRVDMVPVPAGSSFTEADLVNGSVTQYVKPSGTAASNNYAYNDNGAVRVTGCTTAALSPSNPRYCHIRFTGMPANRYYVKVTPLYKPAALTVCSSTCDPASRERLAEAQAEVDSTGRASDILHRIQVRVDISGLDGPFPSFAIESGEDICKRLTIIPDDTIGSGGSCSSKP